jgi:hypothetical protein
MSSSRSLLYRLLLWPERVQQLARRPDWEVACELKQMLIAGNQERTRILGEGEQVVVAAIARAPRRLRWVWSDRAEEPQARDELPGVVTRDPGTEFRIGEGATEFREQLLGNQKLEVTGQPA